VISILSYFAFHRALFITSRFPFSTASEHPLSSSLTSQLFLSFCETRFDYDGVMQPSHDAIRLTRLPSRPCAAVVAYIYSYPREIGEDELKNRQSPPDYIVGALFHPPLPSTSRLSPNTALPVYTLQLSAQTVATPPPPLEDPRHPDCE